MHPHCGRRNDLYQCLDVVLQSFIDLVTVWTNFITITLSLITLRIQFKAIRLGCHVLINEVNL